MGSSDEMRNPQEKLFIIDTDAGVDDAASILVALNHRKPLNVLAITTVSGNTSVDQVCRNVLRTLNVANRLDIPVYRGADKPICGRPSDDASHYHGNDGLGDATETDDAQSLDDRDFLKPGYAAVELVRIVNEHPGQITLLCLAPLTNIAVALLLDPEFGRKLHGCCIMGGNYKGKGNATPSAEFNFFYDPEAADATLNSLHCPITLITWELCLDSATLPWEWYDKVVSIDSARGRFVRSITASVVENFYDRKSTDKEQQGYTVCDEIVAALSVDERIATTSIEVKCIGVERNGQMTRGQTIFDWSASSNTLADTSASEAHSNPERGQKVRLVTHLDRELLQQTLIDAFQ